MQRHDLVRISGAMALLAAAGCRSVPAPGAPTAPESAMALAAPTAAGFVADLHARNDDSVPQQLDRQQRDRAAPNFGGVRAPNGLYHAGAAAGFLSSLAAAYVSAQSRHAHSPRLLAALDDAATFLLDVQHDDGTIDLLTTNFHSPPDTGFVLEWVCAATGVLAASGDPAVEPTVAKLKTFVRRAADALAVGGIHTPNHRWVVCMALARANRLVPDPRYVARIDTWLAEHVDIDADGQFTERSTSIYSPLTDRCLLTVARLLDRPELLAPVRQNLEMSLYYLHADGRIATEGSRRQDQYADSTMVPYYYPYRYLAQRDGNGRFAAVARQLEASEPERLTGQLIYFVESPELAGPLPESAPLPSDFEQHFAHSGLVRIRRGAISATLLADNPAFFSLHAGGAAVVMRCASAFFGIGQFVGSELHRDGDAWVMQQDLVGPYYQPIAAELRRDDGDWHATGPQLRAQSNVQALHAVVRIREQPGGFDVELELTGTAGVPVAVEFGGPADTQLEGALPIDGSPGAWLLPDRTVLSRGADRIRVQNGQVAHEWTQIRGALPKLDGHSVYATGFTPLHRTFEFRVDGSAR